MTEALIVLSIGFPAALAYTAHRLFAYLAVRDADYIAQVDGLCQRLQAPEQAVITHAAKQFPTDPPTLPVDNDSEWEKWRRETVEVDG